MKHRKGRDSISDLNAAAATLPATRTNEPRSHVLLFYSVLLELTQLESFRLVSVSFIGSIEKEKNEFFISLSNTVAAHLIWKLSTFSPKITVHKVRFLCTKDDSKRSVRLLTQSGC
jgi:hypothetical protein